MSDAVQSLTRMREEAAQWAVLLAGGDIDAGGRAQLNAWRARDPRHQRLLDEMLGLWNAITPDTPVPSPGPRAAVARSRKRRLTGAGISLLVLLPCLVFLAREMPWRYWLADQRTEIAEVRRIVLADGSRLTLNGNTAVDIDLSGAARRVRLRRGEIHVEVAKGHTPFVVIDRDGGVRALGTRYAVRRDDDDTLVIVDESSVQVRPRAARDNPIELRAGEQLRFDRNGLTQQRTTASALALSWKQGRLVFDDAPLSEVLRELSRYRPGLLLGADDPALAAQRFTGVLPVAQSDQALALLKAAMPLQVTRVGPWLVRVSARPSGNGASAQ